MKRVKQLNVIEVFCPSPDWQERRERGLRILARMIAESYRRRLAQKPQEIKLGKELS